ncbi:hypothetical protein SNEBB_003320 [Seison nebaliae]|nr:hypothetical protein SNEBB_003320 [Seison nebaliae]
MESIPSITRKKVSISINENLPIKSEQEQKKMKKSYQIQSPFYSSPNNHSLYSIMDRRTELKSTTTTELMKLLQQKRKVPDFSQFSSYDYSDLTNDDEWPMFLDNYYQYLINTAENETRSEPSKHGKLKICMLKWPKRDFLVKQPSSKTHKSMKFDGTPKNLIFHSKKSKLLNPFRQWKKRNVDHSHWMNDIENELLYDSLVNEQLDDYYKEKLKNKKLLENVGRNFDTNLFRYLPEKSLLDEIQSLPDLQVQKLLANKLLNSFNNKEEKKTDEIVNCRNILSISKILGDIDDSFQFNLCSHLLITEANINLIKKTIELEMPETYTSTCLSWLMNRWKLKNSSLKILISFGFDDDVMLQLLYATADVIREFATNSINWINQNGFDGIVVNWNADHLKIQKPTTLIRTRQYVADKRNEKNLFLIENYLKLHELLQNSRHTFSSNLLPRSNIFKLPHQINSDAPRRYLSLILAFRQSIENHNRKRSEDKRITLFSVIPGYVEQLNRFYKLVLKHISTISDYLIVRSVDMFDKNINETRPHSALYPRTNDMNEVAQWNDEYIINYIYNLGVDLDRIILTIPLYGRSFELGSPNSFTERKGTYVEMNSKYPGNGGHLTKKKGYWTSYELCDGISRGYGLRYYDHDTETPFIIFNETTWITFEDPISHRAKTQFIHEEGLGGVAIMHLNDDDATGQYCKQNPFSLSHHVLEEIGNYEKVHFRMNGKDELCAIIYLYIVVWLNELRKFTGII